MTEKTERIVKKRYIKVPFDKLKPELPSSLVPTPEGEGECINIKSALNVTYTWNIANFNSNFDGLESPVFSDGRNIEWRMKIIKKNDSTESLTSGEISQPQNPSEVPSPHQSVFGPAEEVIYCVKLFLVSSDVRTIQSHCKFQLVSTIPKNTITWSNHFLFNFIGMSLNCFEIKRHNVLNVFNGFLQDGSITITCEINAVVKISIPYTMPKCTLLDDFKAFFENQEFTDFTFCVSGGKEFHVHKAILAARSPVFKALFQPDMEESKDNRIELSEVKEKVFRELLRFVYTGKVQNLNEIAVGLYPVADRYGLENLKVLCFQEMCVNISVKNAVDVLILANLHGLDQLKAVAIGYIGSHAVDVSETPGWNDLIRSHPELFTEFLINVSTQLLQVVIS